ncbi:MAG TPA: M56 family metallopeptidase [Saprospiraceae bacterium]|nr:M56 family metallopeptidase [Saprospiraceae bacterium]
MIDNLMNNAVITALGWTLVHSLWIALVFAGITRLFFTKVDAKRALLRYRISLGSMVGLLVLTIGIFVHYYTSFEAPEVALGPEISMQTNETVFLDWEQVAPTESASPWSWSQVALQLEHYFPILVLLWLLGATFMGVRLAGSWWYLHRMGTQGLQTPDEEWTRLFNHLCTKMGVRRPVRLYWSERVQEPVTLRHIKPIVLFPLGLLTQLSPEQVEIVLLHELAHIKRWDYLVNWVQSLLELLFFYHPAVWWLSAQVRTAREHCCDDLVLQADQQQRMLYAQTLTQLSVYSLNFKSKLAMSYSGNNNQSFTFRVKRLFGQADQSRMGQKPILSGLLVLAFMALIMLNSSNVFAENPTPDNAEEALLALLDPEIRNLVLDEETLILDTIPVQKKENSSEASASLEGVTPIYFLDGKKISKTAYDQLGITPDQISRVDVKKDAEIDGISYPEGAVMIYTKAYVAEQEGRLVEPDDLVEGSRTLFGVKPLIIMDGKRLGSGKELLEKIEPEKIATVNVYKDEKAIEKFGSEAQNGVVEVFTKDYLAKQKKESPAIDAKPLIILDGVRQGFGKEKLEDLISFDIASIKVLKGKSATEKYGVEAAEGAIEVYTIAFDVSQQTKEEGKTAATTVQGYRRTTETEGEVPASKIKVRGIRKAEDGKPLFIIDGIIVGRSTTDEELQKMKPADIESINVLKGESATKKYGDAGTEGVVEITTKKKEPTTTSMKMGKDLKKSVFKYGPKGSLRKMNPLVVLNEKAVGRASNVGSKFKEGEMDMIRFSGPSPELLFRFGKEAGEGVVFVTTDVEAKAVEAKGLDDSMVYINGEKRGLWKEVKGSIDKTQIASVNIYGKEVLPAEYAGSPHDVVLVTLKDQMQKGDGRAVELSFQGKASIGSPDEKPMEMDADDFTMTLKNLQPANTDGEDKITRFSAEEGISIKAFLHDNARHPLLILDGEVAAAHDPAIQNLASETVKEVILIEGGPALLPYGEAAKYGVMRIYTDAGITKERGTSNSVKISEEAFEKYQFKAGPNGQEKPVDPLVILNGKPVGKHSAFSAKNSISIDEIEYTTFTGFATDDQIQRYGDAAREGIVQVYTKDAMENSSATTLESKVDVFPNPFGSSTRINFDLESPARVKVSVFNAQGQLIKTLVDGQLPAGPQQFDWNSAGAPVGTYTVIVESGEWRSNKTIVKQ